MGCVCCSLSSFISILLDSLERISLCTVCCMLTCCLLFTILAVMVMGIGIGFHYCFVQNSVDAMAKAAKAAGAVRSGPESARSGGGEPIPQGNMGPGMMRSVGKAMNRGFGYRSREKRGLNRPPLAFNQHVNLTGFTDINGTYTNGTYNITNINGTYNITDYDDYGNETIGYNGSEIDKRTLIANERKANATSMIAHVYYIIKNVTGF